MKNVIFYFSGTGNSLQVAQDISEEIGDCELICIPKYNRSKPIRYDSVGFVYPTYFWGLPNIVRKFLSDIRIEGATYLYGVTTMGGSLGVSLIQLRKGLRAKGYKLHAGFFIYMPDNYVVMYAPLSKEKIEKMLAVEKEKIPKIAENILSRSELPLEITHTVYDRLLGNVLNKTIVPRFYKKDKGFHVSEECTRCGKCRHVCSVGNITLTDGRPTWQHHCEFCMGCINVCPVKAINFKNKTQKRGRYFNFKSMLS